MTVRKTEDRGWFVDFVFRHPDGRRERVRATSPVQTRRGAEEFERKLREDLLEHPNRREEEKNKEEVPTLAAFAEEFIENYALTNNKPSEVRMKRSTLRYHLIPAFGRKRLDEIGAREIEKYKADKLKTKISKKSINNHLTILRKMISVARDWEIIKNVPRVKWFRVPKAEFDFLDFEEAERLIAGAESEWVCMITLAIKTGLRQGELLSLRWDDLDLVRGRLMVKRAVWRGHEGTPKNGLTRDIPLSPIAVDVLKDQRHLRCPLVFCLEDGRQMNENHCRRPLYRACARAGLRRIGWHVLRHTFASHLVMRGVPLEAVQELLGHSTMEMTMRYAHLSPDVRRDAVTKLDDPLPKRGTYMAQDSEPSAKGLKSVD